MAQEQARQFTKRDPDECRKRRPPFVRTMPIDEQPPVPGKQPAAPTWRKPKPPPGREIEDIPEETFDLPAITPRKDDGRYRKN